LSSLGITLQGLTVTGGLASAPERAIGRARDDEHAPSKPLDVIDPRSV
jgi:hypothetical protein